MVKCSERKLVYIFYCICVEKVREGRDLGLVSLDNFFRFGGKYLLFGVCFMLCVDVEKGYFGLVFEILIKVVGNVGCKWKICFWRVFC